MLQLKKDRLEELAAILFIGCCVLVSSARAEVYLCNDSAERIRLADRWVEYVEGSSRKRYIEVVEGWEQLAQGECTEKYSPPDLEVWAVFAETTSQGKVEVSVPSPPFSSVFGCIGGNGDFKIREDVYPGVCEEKGLRAAYFTILDLYRHSGRISLKTKASHENVPRSRAKCEQIEQTFTRDTGRGWGHEGTWIVRLPRKYRMCSYEVSRKSANPNRKTYSDSVYYRETEYPNGVKVDYDVPNVGNIGAAKVFGKGERSWLTIRIRIQGTTCSCN